MNLNVKLCLYYEHFLAFLQCQVLTKNESLFLSDSSTGRKLVIETLMEEVESTVFAKYEFQFIDESNSLFSCLYTIRTLAMGNKSIISLMNSIPQVGGSRLNS